MPRNRYHQGPPTDHFDGVRFFNPGEPDSDRTLLQVLRWRLAGGATTWPAAVPVTPAKPEVRDGTPSLHGWSPPTETIEADGVTYMRDMSGGGGIGTIKAFRDPAWFLDPADGAEYLLFTGSLAQSRSDWNGAIGLARRDAGGWGLMPPLVTADGLNNELERPHVVLHGGRYICFWSTQAKVFATDGPSGPSGLYGIVADSMSGPWRPLNGSGLVLANPAEAPLQAYSWLVLDDLSVLSFADMLELGRPPRDAAEARAHFGGFPAPETRLRIAGDTASPA